MSVRKLIAASIVLGALISVAGFCFKWRLELDWSAALQADLLEDLAVQVSPFPYCYVLCMLLGRKADDTRITSEGAEHNY